MITANICLEEIFNEIPPAKREKNAFLSPYPTNSTL